MGKGGGKGGANFSGAGPRLVISTRQQTAGHATQERKLFRSWRGGNIRAVSRDR